LAGPNISSVELLSYQLRECLQPGWGDGGAGACLGDHAIECGLGDLPLQLQRLDPFLKVTIEINDASHRRRAAAAIRALP
jgi:hypothetical protein